MSKVTYETDSKSEWDKRTTNIQATEATDIPFAQVFEKYLPKNTAFSCLEIGSIPGNFLAYLHGKFGYKVTGIDFADNITSFHETMRMNGIKNYKFVHGDFFKHKFSEQFNVVTSYGFIEHFDDIDDVLKRHADLVKPGGYLVMTMPNFRYLQYAYHYYFDRSNLDIHNVNTMKIGRINKKMKKLGLDKLHSGYLGGLKVWREETELTDKKRRQANSIHRWIEKNGNKFPKSRFYSPYIVLIYKKPLKK